MIYSCLYATAYSAFIIVQPWQHTLLHIVQFMELVFKEVATC